MKKSLGQVSKERIARIFSQNGTYLLFSFIIPVVLTYLVYLTINIHPFGDSSVLVLDLNGQYVYFLESLRNAVYGEGSFLYTFSRALGGEYMGIYTYYLASPLSYIVALFPQENILEAILTIILLKVGLCGLTMGFYLHKNSKQPNKAAVVCFSVMYAMCAYVVVHQNNLMWLDAIFWLPIITYAIEQLIKKGHYKLFLISLAMSMMSNYYIGYMCCIWCVIYFFYYFAANGSSLNTEGRRYFLLKRFIRFALFSLLAAAISAVALLSAYYSLTFGKTDFTHPSWAFVENFNLFHFFTKLLPGAYDTVRPDGLPFVYCGVLTLILLPIYFTSKAIKLRERASSLALICFMLFCFIARPLDLVWHGFQNPNWLNHRYSFMLCFFMLTLGYRALGNIRRCSKRVLTVTCVAIATFALVCNFLRFNTYLATGEKLSLFGTVIMTVILTTAFLLVLLAWIKARNVSIRDGISAVIACIVCIEMMINATFLVSAFDKDVSYSNYSEYNDFIGELRPVVDQVRALDSSFYRMEKLIHRKHNDNMALGIRGLSNSTSTLNASTIKFLENMGYASRSHLSNYQGGNPVNDSLLGVKYVIGRSESKALARHYNEVISNEKYDVYQNPYALSLAYGVSEDVSGFDFDQHKTLFEKLNALVGTLNGYESTPAIFKPIRRYDMSTSGCTLKEADGLHSFSSDAEGQASEIIFEFVATHSADYYFHTPTKDRQECLLEINGQKIGEYLGNDENSIFSLGWHKKGAKVTVKVSFFDADFSIDSTCDYIWYLDDRMLADCFADLGNNPQLAVDEGCKDDHITGRITTEDESTTILATIPYDAGWKIYVDGAQLESYRTLDALIAFDISGSGEHSVEFIYSPALPKLGMIISIAGTFIFATLIATEFVIKKKRGARKCVSEDTWWILEDFEEDDSQLDIISNEDQNTDNNTRNGDN